MNRIIVKILLIVCFILPKAEQSFGQHFGYLFKNVGVASGLPSSEVHCILSDSQHYLWFATDHGVVKYNGRIFKQIDLPTYGANFLYEDARKRVWIATFSSELYYVQDDKVYPYLHNDVLRNLKVTAFSGFMFDANGDLFFNAAASPGASSYKLDSSGHLSRLASIDSIVEYVQVPDYAGNPFVIKSKSYPDSLWTLGLPVRHFKQQTRFKKDSQEIIVNTPEGFTDGRKFNSVELDDGSLIVACGTGVFYFPKDGEPRWEETFSETLCMTKLNNGNIWVGTISRGILIFDSKFRKIGHLLDQQSVTSVCQDYLGGVWVGTLNQGVLYCESLAWGKFTVNGTELQVPMSSIEFHGKDIYLASKNNFLYMLRDTMLRSYDLPVVEISDIFYSKKYDRLLVSGLARSYSPYYLTQYNTQGREFVLSNISSKFYRTKIGNLIILFNQLRTVDLTSMETKFLAIGKERLRVVYPLSDGKILVGSQSRLLYLKGDTLLPYEPAIHMPESRVTDIVEMHETIVVGTRDQGLFFFKGDSMYHMDESSGLLDNNVTDMEVDKDGLWVSTTRGLELLNYSPKFTELAGFRVISARNLQDIGEINCIKTEDNLLYLATDQGAIRLFKSVFYSIQKFPDVYLGSINIDDVLQGPGDSYSMDFRQRKLDISLDVLYYGSSRSFRTRYRLDPDEPWRMVSGDLLEFLEFPYGAHRLEIQVTGAELDWTDGRQFLLNITRKKPFWLTSWFYFLAGVITALIAYLFIIRKRAEQQRRIALENELKRKATEMELKAIRAQMNPHFIFNSINSIQYFITNHDERQAQYYLNRFAKLVRRILESSRTLFITLEDEISILNLYLEFEQLRFEERFVYEIINEVDLPASGLRIPNMMIQPVVENAVKHAFPGNRKGKILVRFFRVDERLICEVKDDGIGINIPEAATNQSAARKSLGIRLIREKLKSLSEMYDYSASVDLTGLRTQSPGTEDNGVTVRFSFPLEVSFLESEDENFTE